MLFRSQQKTLRVDPLATPARTPNPTEELLRNMGEDYPDGISKTLSFKTEDEKRRYARHQEHLKAARARRSSPQKRRSQKRKLSERTDVSGK